MDIAFNVPVNRVSFGQVSYNLLRVAKELGHNVFLIPIGPIDVTAFEPDEDFKKWLGESVDRMNTGFHRDMPCIKLWHIGTPDEQIGARGSFDQLTNKTSFISFYELDKPTELEAQVVRNFDMVFTSRYTCETFQSKQAPSRFVPLGVDPTFVPISKRYFSDDRIVFGMLGKFEHRKHHQKMIGAWVKRFGNNKRYYLQCAVYNPFFNPQMNANLISGSMGNKHYWNVNPITWVPTNTLYNEFLNSNHIVLGLSGAEGWGIPEFNSVAIGKHAVILNAHAYKEWADDKNAVLVEPCGKVPAYDGVFFKPGGLLNQGDIFTWDEDAFIAGCEAAVERYVASPVNNAGLELRHKFSYEKTFAAIINKL